VGTGPAGLGGAGCPAGRSPAAAGAAGLAAGVAGVAGFAGAAGGAAFSGVDPGGGDGLLGVVWVSDGTEAEGGVFTPLGVVVGPAVALSLSGGGDAGDLVSSDIGDGTDSGATCLRKNVHFYQLDEIVSTTAATEVVKVFGTRGHRKRHSTASAKSLANPAFRGLEGIPRLRFQPLFVRRTFIKHRGRIARPEILSPLLPIWYIYAREPLGSFVPALSW